MEQQAERLSLSASQDVRGTGPVPCVRRAFAVLRQYARVRERKVQFLSRSLAAWRRHQLAQHLSHWRRMVCEGRSDALAEAIDRWRQYTAAAQRSRMLEERCVLLQQALRRQPLELYLQWWSFIADISIAQRRSCMGGFWRALQAGAQACASMRAAKSRAQSFCRALVQTRALRHWIRSATDSRCLGF
jgi:hypothetical protein